MLAIEVSPREDINNMWKMKFDEAKSQSGMGEGIVFTYPYGNISCYSFHWNFMELTM
jgi:hypothetical protein